MCRMVWYDIRHGVYSSTASLYGLYKHKVVCIYRFCTERISDRYDIVYTLTLVPILVNLQLHNKLMITYLPFKYLVYLFCQCGLNFRLVESILFSTLCN